MGGELTSLELFTGAGGLAYGIKRAAFRHLALVEWDIHARATIKGNNERGNLRPHWPLLETPNVKDVDFASYEGKVNLLAGGPPCQPFSVGGVHRGDLDDRNMFPEAIRAVRECAPDAFMFENVRGLARQSFRPYLEYIVAQLSRPWLLRRSEEDWQSHALRLAHAARSKVKGDGPSYRVEWRPISCSDYGAPQIRERVIFLGIREDLGVEVSWPKPTHSREALLRDQLVTGDYWERHGIKRRTVPMTLDIEKLHKQREFWGDEGRLPWQTVRDAVRDLGPAARNACRTSIEHRQHVHIPGARSYAGHTGSPLDWPAKALKAGVHGVPGGENTVVSDNGRIRYFTIREAARLMGFPDSYCFEGSWGECMRQIGNAVPVMVAQVLASHVKKVLKTKATSLSRVG